MKQFFKHLTMLCALAAPVVAQAQSANVYLPGTYDVGGTTEYSQYLYIGPGATINIPAGQQWTIASQYVHISPLAVINGGGQMIFENPGKIGVLNETVAWAGQPTTVDGGNSQIMAQVINRNPNNIVLGAVSVTQALSASITVNASNNLYIGTGFTWASTNADGTALTGNDVLLGNADLRFSATATEAGYDANSFAVTGGNGYVVKDSYTGAFTYPVGIAEGDYTPAAITNTVANGLHVRVQDYATSTADENFGTAGAGVDRTWNIYADNATGNSSINLQHNTGTNAATFSNTSYYVTQYGSATPNTSGDVAAGNGTAWQQNAPGAGTTGNLVAPAATVAGSDMGSHSYTSFATTAAATTAFFTKLSPTVTVETPNLSPTIAFLPSSIIGTQAVDVLVKVYEFNNIATNGSIALYVQKDPNYMLSFDPTAAAIGGQAVENSIWSFDDTSNPGYYILTTTAVIPASGVKALGFTTTYNPNYQVGNTVINAIITDNSGGESSANNVDNNDDDRLDYSF